MVSENEKSSRLCTIHVRIQHEAARRTNKRSSSSGGSRAGVSSRSISFRTRTLERTTLRSRRSLASCSSTCDADADEGDETVEPAASARTLFASADGMPPDASGSRRLGDGASRGCEARGPGIESKLMPGNSTPRETSSLCSLTTSQKAAS